MSLNIPSHFDLDLGLDLDLHGIPTNYSFAITQLPKINVGLDPMTFKVEPLEIKPLDMSFRLKEIPSVRVHFPVDYRVAVGFLGIELACVRLCGQSQVITEPYVPNPCERIDTVPPRDIPQPDRG
jgi:hypothetical protein